MADIIIVLPNRETREPPLAHMSDQNIFRQPLLHAAETNINNVT